VLTVMRTLQRDRSQGQALVEFALVIPVFLLIVFSVVQFGMIMGAQDALTSATREATRYASTVPVSNTTDAGSCSSGTGAQVYSKLQSVLAQKMPGYIALKLVACGAAAPSTTVGYCRRQNPDLTWSIWVQVTAVYRHPLYIPLVGNIVDGLDGTSDGNLRASASEQMRVETYSLSGSYLGGFGVCS
jgi:Flp pilus assembly protein TadG